MQIVKPVGREAASRKYDLLSALTVHGLTQKGSSQVRMLRLVSLITARYNWQRDELCVGQREMARMWSVDERTVKREMAWFRTQGWLVQKSRGARGRISVYGLDLLQIFEDTRPAWALIGEDFAARLGAVTPAENSEATACKVVPLRPVAVPTGSGAWARAQAILAEEQPALYGVWFQGLAEVEAGQGVLVLAAGSGFQQSYITTHFRQMLLAAARRVDPSITRIEITC